MNARQDQGTRRAVTRGLTNNHFRAVARAIRRPADPSAAPGQTRPAPATTTSRRRTMTMPRLLPHTIQLCVHCRQDPAGFWVSQQGSKTVRRLWCLSCCQDLDPACHHVKPFDP